MEENGNSSEDTNVKVAVRCRPFNAKEKSSGEVSCVKITSDHITLTDPRGNGEEHSFAFDIIFDQDSLQTTVWDAIGVPTLTKAFNGYNGTIFAYGQTGSGKTWSMQGADEELQGIIPRMNKKLFERISVEKEARPSMQFLVTVSYFEIYNEVIFDLLDANDRKKRGVGGCNKGGLEIKEHPVLGVYVKGLQEIVVETPGKLQDIIDQGMRSRTVASTQMNADSSRSHSVFTITIHQKDPEDETKNVFAKVNLVDLAGSERVKSTGATGATLKEGANINKSLSELGNVINALVEKAKGKKGVFVPYRNSKLTRVLQESLGGNSITSMLAALSPAACNFEETLSTLKYANRAKAIKVNAVKNDEASQISRLNDEIRALKEKLANQRPESSADPTVLEERHQNQLRELEEAMRSTWEEKAKVSEEHEKERKRLEAEQRAAERQLAAARERNWRLLEEKNDIDMSLSHLRELSRRDPMVSTQIGVWLAKLRELTKLEQNLGEQDTVIQVYRSALEKDSATLLSSAGGGSGSNFRSPTHQTSFNAQAAFASEKASLSLWRQFRDKFNAILNEVKKWTKMQDALLAAVEEFSSALLVSQQSFSERMETVTTGAAQTEGAADASGTIEGAALSPEDAGEITRGLQLLRKQAKSKHSKLLVGVSTTRSTLIDFSSMSDDLVQSLSQHERFIEESMKAESRSESDDEMHEALVALQKQEKALLAKLKRCASALMATFAETTTTSPRDGKSGTAAQKTPRSGRAKDEVAIMASEFRMKCSPSSGILAGPNPGATGGELNALIDGNAYWGLKPSSSSNIAVADEYIEVALHRPRQLSTLVIQGGQAAVVKPVDAADDDKSSANKVDGEALNDPAPSSSSSKSTANANIAPSDITLPCGISLTNCTGDVDQTAAAVADIMSWEALIKKNPPDKFLRRPPVRFLFDLFQFVGKEVAAGIFPASVCTADWETVGASKQSKSEYMSQVITTLSSYLSVEPATTATNIVTGTDAPLTCVLLQHLAIAVQLFNTRTAAGAASDAEAKEAHGSSSASAKASKSQKKEASGGRNGQSGSQTVFIPTWPTEVRLYFSPDGEEWSTPQLVATGLQDATSKASIPLAPLLAKLRMKGTRCVRIQPVAFSSSDSLAAAMRVAVRAFADEDSAPESSAPNSARSPRAAMAASSTKGDQLIPPERVTAALSTMHETSEAMIAAIEFIGKIDEMRKAKKQEEIRKQMEGLANEKQVLEQRLANEQRALANEKQDLSDQLKDALLKLKETQALLERERAVKAQLELDQSQLEAEKAQLQTSLQEQSDEMVALKTDLLKLQANKEKDRMLVETLRAQVAEGEQKLYELTTEADESTARKQQWESEKDDLLSQIAVLTEERDTAHGNEESLFEQLAERTQDLERLQESYVDMTDRCNDAMDEISELREQLEGYKEALASASHASSSSNGLANGNSNKPSGPTPPSGPAPAKKESSSMLPAITAIRSPRSQQPSPRAQGTSQMLGRAASPTQSQSMNSSRRNSSYTEKSTSAAVPGATSTVTVGASSSTGRSAITSASFSATQVAVDAEDVDFHLANEKGDSGKAKGKNDAVASKSNTGDDAKPKTSSSGSSFLPSVAAAVGYQRKGASADHYKVSSADTSSDVAETGTLAGKSATSTTAAAGKNDGDDDYDDDFDDYGAEEFEDP